MHSYIENLPSIIEEIWILTSKGIPLSHFSREENPDSETMGRFLSAMRGFCAEMSNGKFQTFSMADSKFISIPCKKDDVMIFCKSPMKAKEKKILNICKTISNISEDYIGTMNFAEWDGEVSFFDELRKRIELFFKMSDL